MLIIEDTVALWKDGESTAVWGHVVYVPKHAQIELMAVGMGFERQRGKIALGNSTIDSARAAWHRKFSCP